MIKLPLKYSTVEALSTQSTEHLLDDCSVLELACIQAINTSADLLETDTNLFQRVIAQFISDFLKVDRITIARHIESHFGLSPESLREIKHKIAWQSEHQKTIKPQDFVDRTYQWRFQSDLSNQEPKKITGEVGGVAFYHEFSVDEQQRALQHFIRNSTENLEIHGYAGSGKTQLLKMMLRNTPRKFSGRFKKTILLTSNAELAQAFLKMNLKTNILTAEQLISSISNYRVTPSWQASDIAQIISVIGAGQQANPRQYVSNILSTVNNYCRSTDYKISEKHCPDWMSATEMSRNIIDANLLFQSIRDSAPEERRDTPYTWLHACKHMLQTGLTWNVDADLIFIDEAQNLPPSFIKLLMNVNAATVFFQDEYQNLKTHEQHQIQDISKRQLYDNYRSGSNIVEHVNQTLLNHPDKPNGLLNAKSISKGTVEYTHDNLASMASTSTAIFDNFYKMLEFAIRLKHIKQPYFIDTYSAGILKNLYTDLLNLSLGRSANKVFELRYFQSLEALANSNLMPKDCAELFINLFQKHKSMQFIEELLSQSIYTPQSTRLIHIHNTPGLEFESASISSELCQIDESTYQDHVNSRNKLYCALSRVKNKAVLASGS